MFRRPHLNLYELRGPSVLDGKPPPTNHPPTLRVATYLQREAVIVVRQGRAMEAPLPAGGFTAALRAPRGRRSSKDFESSVLPELANGGQKSGRSRRASKDNLFSGVLGEAGADRPAQPIRRAKGRRRRAS